VGVQAQREKVGHKRGAGRMRWPAMAFDGSRKNADRESSSGLMSAGQKSTTSKRISKVDNISSFDSIPAYGARNDNANAIEQLR